MYIKNLIILILLLNELINGYDLNLIKEKDDELDCNEELAQLGCSCFSDLNLQLKQGFNTCSYLRLGCILDKNISYNYYNVTSSMNRLIDVCWSQLYFENVYSLTSNSLVNLKFASFNQQKNVYITYKNVYEIDSCAFEKVTLKNNENLIIKLDSSLSINSNQTSPSLALKPNCFANIQKCKVLELANFYNSKSVYLHTSMFKGSFIENLVISYSTFDGFNSDLDSRSDETQIKNIIIDNSNINILGFNTIGKFYMLEGVEIQNSGVVLVAGEALYKCCEYIKYLLLNNNQIKTITSNTFKELYYLLYLSLANNPLETIEPSAFDSFRKFLIKLNLESTSLASLNGSFYDMQLLRDLILSNTNYLSFGDIKVILENAPSLQYLNLANSGIVKNATSLNDLLDEIDANIKSQQQKNDYALTDLNYIDVSTSGVHLNENKFRDSFERNRNCLWEKLLSRTFIKVHSEHPCNCALFFLYRNITKFNFPNSKTINLTSSYDNNNYELTSLNFIRYSNTKTTENLNDWELILSNMPKCYKIFWMQNYNFNSIIQQEIECGLWDNNLNCSDIPTTLATTETTSEELTSTSDIITTEAPSTTETHHLSTNEPTTVDNQITDTTEILVLKKQIVSKLTLPILLSVFASCIFILLIIAIKAKYDYKNKFLRIYNKTLIDSPKQSREMENIAIISSINNTIEPFIFDIDDTSNLISN